MNEQGFRGLRVAPPAHRVPAGADADSGIATDGQPTLEIPAVRVGAAAFAGHAESYPSASRGVTVLVDAVERLGRVAQGLLARSVVFLAVAMVAVGASRMVPWNDIESVLERLRDLIADTSFEARSEVAEERPTWSGSETPEREQPPSSSPAGGSTKQPPTEPPPPELAPSEPDAERGRAAGGPWAAPDVTSGPDEPGSAPWSTETEVAAFMPARTAEHAEGPVTHSAVDRLALGMTIDQVTRIVGVEGWDHVPGFSHGPVIPTDPTVSAQYSGDSDGSRWTIRTWPEQYFGPASAHVIFRDGRAVEITTS